MKIYKIRLQRAKVQGSPDLYVGIDVHLKTWHVTILHEGAILFSSGIPGQWEVLGKLLDRYKGYRIHAVYEAGYFGYSLYDHLVHYGANCFVAAPSIIPRSFGNRVKTDRIDSTKLAVLLWQGALNSITVPTQEERSHRTVVRRYHQLVRDCIRIQLRIKAELRFNDIPFPSITGSWTKQFVENLHRLKFTDRWLQESFNQLLTAYDQLRAQIDKQRHLIHELAKLDRYRDRVKILRTIPGIGILTAMEFLVELQDMRRFRTGDQLAAYVGLTPSQHSSGEHVRMGRITRIGKGQLRGMLVEASWILIRKDPLLRAKYEALKHRAGAKKAIVAIARKLLIRARRVILDGTPYVSGKAA
jgi:transposase